MGTKAYRWHFIHEGRTFIVYAPTINNAKDRAKTFTGHAQRVYESGYYCRKTNTVIGATDGPTTFEDNRKSGM